MLANVQAIVKLSQSDTSKVSKQAIEGRIRALANVHSLFVKTRWIGAELSTIANRSWHPTPRKTRGACRLTVQQVLLKPDAAQTIAMTLARAGDQRAKYGALSTAKGRHALQWSHESDGRLTVHWTETGGPAREDTEPSRLRRAGDRTHGRRPEGQNELRLAPGRTCLRNLRSSLTARRSIHSANASIYSAAPLRKSPTTQIDFIDPAAVQHKC